MKVCNNWSKEWAFAASLGAPEGYTATPPDANLVLDPGESKVCGFRWSGSKPAVAGLLAEAVFTIRAVGELRESGTLEVADTGRG